MRNRSFGGWARSQNLKAGPLSGDAGGDRFHASPAAARGRLRTSACASPPQPTVGCVWARWRMQGCLKRGYDFSLIP
ncbi:MAG TPA: hypothetical protein PKV33_00485 [Methanothrix sp.]|nr:hypothetical protein [Methanothrix sp.]